LNGGSFTTPRIFHVPSGSGSWALPIVAGILGKQFAGTVEGAHRPGRFVDDDPWQPGVDPGRTLSLSSVAIPALCGGRRDAGGADRWHPDLTAGRKNGRRD
jgi:hypothetical protein